MSNEQDSSGPGLLAPALALGAGGLGIYGMHRAGWLGARSAQMAKNRALAESAAKADPAVAAAMSQSMRRGPHGPVSDPSVAAHMQAANRQAGANAAQAQMGLKMDPAVEKSLGPIAGPGSATGRTVPPPAQMPSGPLGLKMDPAVERSMGPIAGPGPAHLSQQAPHAPVPTPHFPGMM